MTTRLRPAPHGRRACAGHGSAGRSLVAYARLRAVRRNAPADSAVGPSCAPHDGVSNAGGTIVNSTNVDGAAAGRQGGRLCAANS